MNKFKIILSFILAIEITCTAQNIFTYAGTGTAAYSGDGGFSVAADLNIPCGLTTDASGNVYVCDSQNNRIRKINPSGIITTIIGNGTQGFSGDGGSATSAEINRPNGIALDPAGNIYFCDTYNNRIRKVNTLGIITTIAGTGTAFFSGDGGPATAAAMSSPNQLALDASGNIYVADFSNNRIRKINTSGIISTIAGTGWGAYSGDGGPATLAEISGPGSVAIDPTGNIYIADLYNHRVRMINPAGTISTFAGIGTCGYTGDGGLATSAKLCYVQSVFADLSGNVYIVDGNNNAIRMINTSGIINTIAGTGTGGFSGDGGLATLAQLKNPLGIAKDISGNVYISDMLNNRVRVICNTNCITDINSLSSSFENFSLYPNPNNGSFKLKIDKQIDNAEIVLINSIGQEVYSQKIKQGENIIITQGLSSGLYNYILLQDKKQIENGKLTVDKN